MDNIPKELFIAFPKLLHLDASNIELERLEKYDFLPHSPLISLNVSNNKITKLGALILKNLNNLQLLDASHNRIERINPTTFTLSEKFKYLNLSHNKIVKLGVSLLLPLQSIKELQVDHNLIEEITGDFEDFRPMWEKVYLQHNELVRIDTILFKNVSVLDLSLNKIEEGRFEDTLLVDLNMDENMLKLLTINKNLESLRASGNKENLMHISFEDNKSLKHLDLSETKLKSKDETINYLKNLKKLEYLDLAYTKFVLDSSHLKGLNSLKTLKLQGAVEHQIPPKFFVDLKKLEELDISENFLVSFDLNELKNSKNLEQINLRSSGLSQLSGWKNISTILPSLKKIDFYQNMFNCKELQTILDEFRTLQIQLIELDENGEEEFLNQSCNEKNRHSSNAPQPRSDDNAFNLIWYIVGFISFSLLVIGIIFVNRKFGIFQRIPDIVRCQSRYPKSSLLAEEI